MSLQASPERASEQPIWNDLEAFGGQGRPQALLEVPNHEFAGRPGKRSQNSRFGVIWSHLGGGSAHRHFWRS